MLYDRIEEQKTVLKAFKSRGLITSMAYGPYDNGHILIGTSTGDFLAFQAQSLAKICNLKLSNAVTSITIDPT